MAGTFTVGEEKIRPGVYDRYENADAVVAAEQRDGVGAAVIRADWGPLNTVVSITDADKARKVFGISGIGHTINIVEEMLKGGAVEVKTVRAGTGGSAATITLVDTTSGTALSAVTLTAKYVGSKAFSVTIKDDLADSTKRVCIIYAGTSVFEKVYFTKGASGDGEPAALVAAFSDSDNFTATKVADGNKVMAAVTQSAFTAGSDPTCSSTEYSTAFSAIEATSWNVLIVDTVDTSVHALVASFLERIYEAGTYPIAVLGEAKTTALATRMTNAAAFNSEKIVYVLNSAYDTSGNLYDGYLAAARIGGYVAAIPSNQSLTYTEISGFTSLAEALTDTEINTALRSGCLVLSLNRKGKVRIEQGINTLVTLSGEQDAGWKKIRRVKTRYELMLRVDEVHDELVGKVDNDKDGRATIIAAANGVINEMIKEKKLIDGLFYDDSTNLPQGDSAWFMSAVKDKDSIEFIYNTHKFSFATT